MKMSLKEFKNEIRNLKKGFYRNKYFYYFTLKYVLLSSLFLIGFKFIPPFANTLYLFNHILKTSDITPEFKLILIFANFYIFSIIINILINLINSFDNMFELKYIKQEIEKKEK